MHGPLEKASESFGLTVLGCASQCGACLSPIDRPGLVGLWVREGVEVPICGECLTEERPDLVFVLESWNALLEAAHSGDPVDAVLNAVVDTAVSSGWVEVEDHVCSATAAGGRARLRWQTERTQRE